MITIAWMPLNLSNTNYHRIDIELKITRIVFLVFYTFICINLNEIKLYYETSSK